MELAGQGELQHVGDWYKTRTGHMNIPPLREETKAVRMAEIYRRGEEVMLAAPNEYSVPLPDTMHDIQGLVGSREKRVDVPTALSYLDFRTCAGSRRPN